MEKFAQHWRVGMFWRFFSMMFAASCAATVLFIVALTWRQIDAVKARLASNALHDKMDAEFVAALPLLEQVEASPGLCAPVLRSLATDMFANGVLGRESANSVSVLGASGRFQIRYRHGARFACTYPVAAVPPPSSEDEGEWRLLVRPAAALAQDRALELRVQVRGMRGLLLEEKDAIWTNIFLFLAALNLLCALALVPLLVRRIARAQTAARQWSDGDITARIDDTRQDEFGALVHSFNHLADSFAQTIRAKQDLAASDERNKLARDLHDTAKQRAFALNLQLTALKTIGAGDAGASHKIVSGALVLVSKLQKDLAAVIHRLSGSTIAEWGIRRMLQQEMALLLNGSSIAWRVDISDAVDVTLQLTPHLTQQVFLVALEAVANALRHAGASNITLDIARHGQGYALRVQDDGTGMAGAGAAGMGVANMRLRTQGLPDGSFLVVNGVPHGTVILVTFKLVANP